MDCGFPPANAEFIVVAELTGCELSKNVVGTREFEAGGIKPSNEGAVLHRNDAVSLSTAIGPCQSDSFGVDFRRDLTRDFH